MKLKKITDSVSPPSRRRYDDACGTAHGLDLIGERWALLVMRELMLGPKRFSDIRADLPGLEASGLLVRRRLPPPASSQVYELTEWGYEAEPIVQVLGRWAARSPDHDPSMQISPVSIMLSFRTMFDRERARGLKGRIGFRLGDETFLLELDDDRMHVVRGETAGADVVFTGSAPALAAAVYGGAPFDTLADEGALTVEGDRKLAGRFTTLFPLPPKAERPVAG
jgi:DNA-binding HxlR family transcriptional regulator